MLTQTRHDSKLSTLIASILCMACLTGCHGTINPLASERLDRRTGVTVRTASEPMVFAKTEGQYSRSARDYVYLGPVETNRQGTRDYYLWVGVGSTLDRGFLAPESEVPVTLLVTIDDELMEFKLRPWSDRAPDLSTVPLYSTAVDTRDQLAARVTLHQLALLSSAALESVQLGDDEGNTRPYRRWQGKQGWSGFLREALASGSVATDRTSPP